MKKFSFSKQERLHQRKFLQLLFVKGTSKQLGPFRWHFLALPINQGPPCHQVLFAVPARQVKKAVQRNLCKRRLRAAYRCLKHLLPAPTTIGKVVLLAYVYRGKEAVLPSYQVCYRYLKQSIQQLRDGLLQTH